MVFRTATIADARTLAAARWAFRAEAGETPIESEAAFTARYETFLRSALEAGDYMYWLAEGADGALIAHMAVCVVRGVPRPSRTTDQWGYLTDCYTRPDSRNQGIGGALLAHVIESARARDLEILIVWPSEDAEDFYARAGFRPDEEIRVLHLRSYDAPPARGVS